MGGSSGGSGNTPTVSPTASGGLSNSGGSIGGGMGGSGGTNIPMGTMGPQANATTFGGIAPPTFIGGGMPAYANTGQLNSAYGSGGWSQSDPYKNASSPMGYLATGNTGQPTQPGPQGVYNGGQFAEAPIYNPNVQGSSWVGANQSPFGLMMRGAPGGNNGNPNSNYSSAANIMGGGASGGGFAPGGASGGPALTQGSSQQGPIDINFLLQQALAGGAGGIGGFGLNGRPMGT